jgi:hypothetical protein
VVADDPFVDVAAYVQALRPELSHYWWGTIDIVRPRGPSSELQAEFDVQSDRRCDLACRDQTLWRVYMAVSARGCARYNWLEICCVTVVDICFRLRSSAQNNLRSLIAVSSRAASYQRRPVLLDTASAAIVPSESENSMQQRLTYREPRAIRGTGQQALRHTKLARAESSLILDGQAKVAQEGSSGLRLFLTPEQTAPVPTPFSKPGDPANSFLNAPTVASSRRVPGSLVLTEASHSQRYEN